MYSNKQKMGNSIGADQQATLSTTGTIVLGERSVFCIGDMHGDAHALAKTLAMTGCVVIPDSVHNATRKCPHGNDVDLNAVRWRHGCEDVVMFLGDLLDNRRSAMDEPHGVCATPRTQFAMMDVLVRLKGEAQAHGGDVVLILGNHDVENAIDHRGTGSEQMAEFFCNMHAPYVQNAGDGEYRVCGAAGFTDEHRGKVLPRLAALSGFQVVRRIQGGMHSVLCMHGGLSPELPQIVGLKRGEVDRNLERVNGLFVRALRDNALDARRVILSIGTGEKLPTWCRPTYVDDSEGLEAYFGSTRIVKGHDVQIEGANCNVAMGGTPRLRARNGLFAANEMCRIDVGMSRCFNMYRGRHVPFTVLRLYEADGGIQRDILEERVFLGKDNTF